MKAISYDPSKDELILKFRPLTRNATKNLKGFRLWWDDEGYIYGMDILRFKEVLEEFKETRNTIRLGGLWKGVRIPDEDIREIRRDLFGKLKEKW